VNFGTRTAEGRKLTPPLIVLPMTSLNMRQSNSAFSIVLLVLASLWQETMLAGNILLPGQGSSGMGTAYAGGAAQAEDASAIFYNPAGIALLNAGQLQQGLTAIFPSAQFTNEGSHYDLPNTPFNGLPISGGNGGNPAIAAAIPYLYISQPLMRSSQLGDLAIGFGLSVPFGLQTDYSPGWVGRYGALRSKLSTIDLQPTIAYRIWDCLSVGASLDIQYASARLTQAIDFGLAGAQAVGQFTQALPQLLAAHGVPAAGIPGIVAATQRAYSEAGFVPGGRDGITELSGNNWAVGFTLGAIVEYLKGNEQTFFQAGRVGFSYRSAITQEIQANAQFRGVPAITAPGAPVQFPSPNLFSDAFSNQGASAQLDLPDIYHFSIYQRFLRHLALMGDIEWTRWSRLQSITIKFDNTATPSVPISLNYQDSLRFAIGLEWFATRNFTCRCGFAYDQTPVTSAAFRTPRLPDNDEYSLALGFRWSPTRWMDIDVGYLHIFIPDGQADVADNQGHILRGNFSTASNLVSAGATVHWGGPQEENIIAPPPK
jgi:long-chain fatty acid transport protein